MKREKQPSGERMTVGEVFGRILTFAACGLIILGVYAVVILMFAGVWQGAIGAAEESGVNLGSLWFLLFTVLYILPLYFLGFLRNSGYKRTLLQITERGFDPGKIIREFTRGEGKADLIIYFAYSLVMLLPFGDAFDNPAVFVCIQQVFFYDLPIPRILSYVLAMAVFAVQYYACLLLAARYWDKTRIHRGGVDGQ